MGSASALEEAIADGTVFAWPAEHAVLDHPGSTGPITYLAAAPLDVGDANGGTRHLEPGDVLHTAEAQHAGTALARMLRHHQIVPLPTQRGIVGLVRALIDKVDRLENAAA